MRGIDIHTYNRRSEGLGDLQTHGRKRTTVIVTADLHPEIRITHSVPNEYGDDRSPRRRRRFDHAPCHARNQGLARQALETFREADGAEIEDVGDSCSGISGTYGWKAEKYDYSVEIGAEMFEYMEDGEWKVGMTECPTCATQMAHGTGYEIRHPLEALEALEEALFE